MFGVEVNCHVLVSDTVVRFLGHCGPFKQFEGQINFKSIEKENPKLSVSMHIS